MTGCNRRHAERDDYTDPEARTGLMGWEITAEDWSWVTGQAGTWALVLARVMGLCLTAPVLAVPELDWRFRLALAAALGAVLAPIAGGWIEPPTTWSNAAWAGLSELLAGGLIGWSAALVVAGARGGRPGRHPGRPGNGHAHRSRERRGRQPAGTPLRPDRSGRVSGARWSLAAGPGPGRELSDRAGGPDVAFFRNGDDGLQPGGARLELALRAAAPPALALALAGIVVGWLGRAAPSLPFTALAQPLRSLIGIALVLLSVGALAATFAGAWSALFQP